MINEADSSRRFRNLISTAQLVKRIEQHGYQGKYTEQALYKLFEKYGITPKTQRGGKSFFNKKNACDCIERHIFELKEMAEQLQQQYEPYPEDNQQVGYGRDDMSVASRELLANDDVFGADENELYRTENRIRINISESQFLRLMENANDEGFKMSFPKNSNGQYDVLNPKVVEFDPTNIRGGYSDTSIFKDGTKEFNIRYQELPRSGLKSINLYFIRNMNINKALKHGVNMSGNAINVDNSEATDSLNYFKKRSAYYISRILAKMGIYPDIFTSPQSSSSFNNEMLGLLSNYYPEGDIVMMPNSMKKNVRNVTINVSAAKELGLSDGEIAYYQGKLSHLKQDEDIREYRRKIESLKSEIEGLMTHKRGRPGIEVANRKKLINAYGDIIKANRRRGRDATVDKNGDVKGFQIKSLDDKQRRILDGLFVFNDEEYPSKTYTVNGNEYEKQQYMKFNNKVIVVFDDNISSGATLDMMCDALKKYNPKMIVPITLGQIPLTAYAPSERTNIEKRA